MENYKDITLQLRKELEDLPCDYTELMARRNWDVIYHMVTNFNIGRFLLFMNNFYNHIPDKIRITKFGIDGPPTTAILYFDGKYVIYVVDGTRSPIKQFYYYYGNRINVMIRNVDNNNKMIDYNLMEFDGNEITIIGIWAGFKSGTR